MTTPISFSEPMDSSGQVVPEAPETGRTDQDAVKGIASDTFTDCKSYMSDWEKLARKHNRGLNRYDRLNEGWPKLHNFKSRQIHAIKINNLYSELIVSHDAYNAYMQNLVRYVDASGEDCPCPPLPLLLPRPWWFTSQLIGNFL